MTSGPIQLVKKKLCLCCTSYRQLMFVNHTTYFSQSTLVGIPIKKEKFTLYKEHLLHELVENDPEKEWSFTNFANNILFTKQLFV